ncbi:hypothetical protein KSP39_PZI019085 [Platanthera zijinensis]|uniref:Uncharacterized protein n=1 Tax=Platanthera zijinensis TaxID=2320716 RepID=A0AAP0B247_9ASPA
MLCLCLLLPIVGPRSSKRRKRSRNNRLSSPGPDCPVVSQLLPWLLPMGIARSERSWGWPLGPKLYAIVVVLIDSLLKRHYRTLQTEHLFVTPRFWHAHFFLLTTGMGDYQLARCFANHRYISLHFNHPPEEVLFDTVVVVVNTWVKMSFVKDLLINIIHLNIEVNEIP